MALFAMAYYEMYYSGCVSLQAALEMELIQRLQQKQKEQLHAYQQLEAALGLSKATRYFDKP